MKRDNNQFGHRQRIRDRFLADEESAHSGVALLELLLSYAIPQMDVQPLAKKLIHRFGNLPAVLAADPGDLCQVEGIKQNSAVLLKVVDWIRRQNAPPIVQGDAYSTAMVKPTNANQATLFELRPAPKNESGEPAKSPAAPRYKIVPRRGTELFSNAIFKETVALLSRLPETDSPDDLIAFFRANLPFSSEITRQRYTSYLPRRLFPDGQLDQSLRLFAKAFAGRQEPKDAFLYRFCRSEQLLYTVIEDLVLPAMATGSIDRGSLRQFLEGRYPGKGVDDCAKAIARVFEESGIGHADTKRITFGYRDILIPSFAFVLHSEFPVPGMYRVQDLEQNRAVRTLLWKPESVLPALYELRNRGWIAKISEIDSLRQFTTQYTLDELVKALTGKGVAT